MGDQKVRIDKVQKAPTDSTQEVAKPNPEIAPGPSRALGTTSSYSALQGSAHFVERGLQISRELSLPSAGERQAGLKPERALYAEDGMPRFGAGITRNLGTTLAGGLIGGAIGAGAGALVGGVGGAVLGGIGGAIGGALLGAMLGPHPTSINNTTAGTGRLGYGAVYTHTFDSSTGNVADISGITVGERVTVARDDFGTGWGGVRLGTITATINARGRMNDSIGTPSGAIHPRMGRVRALPAVLDTPQTLHWKDALGIWHKFADVVIRFIVRRRAAGGLEAVTQDNGVSVVEPFTGPAPGGGGGGGGAPGGGAGGGP